MKIHAESLADVMYTLKWNSPGVSHSDAYFGASVNMWRDCFPEKIYEALQGLTEGDRVTFEFEPGEAVPRRSEGRILTIRRKQFSNGNTGIDPIEPMAGRFYPKGLLRDLPGIFPQNVEPFRCLQAGDDKILIDFNHPLAGKSFLLRAQVEAVARKDKERGGSCTDWLEALTQGPGMQARANGIRTVFLSDGALSREDEAPDDRFYQKPRLVNHIDERSRKIVRKVYGKHLRPGMRILDLMAGWESHLPREVVPASVIGLGMNKEEMAANEALSEHIVHDLNRNPILPFDEQAFDAVICTVSVEYLTDPQSVFHEVARVLVPGGVFVVTFSNRWFPPKVTRLWKELHEFERMGFVADLFLGNAAFENIETYSMRGLPRPESDKYYPDVRLSDPVFAVSGKKR